MFSNNSVKSFFRRIRNRMTHICKHYPKRGIQVGVYGCRRLTRRAFPEPELTWRQKWRFNYILPGCRSVRAPRGYFSDCGRRLRVIDDVRPHSPFIWEPHQSTELPLPSTAGSLSPDTEPWPAPQASFVLRVTDGLVAPDGLVFDNRAIYRNGRWYYQPPPDSLPVERYDRLLTLVQLWSNEFIHFSFDTLPRIDIAYEFLRANRDIRILIPEASFCQDIFRLLEISPDRLVVAHPNRIYAAGEVYYPHFYTAGRPFKMGLLPLHSFRRIRKFLVPENSGPATLIVYLKRNPPAPRLVENEEELLRELRRRIKPAYQLKVYAPVNDWQQDRLVMQRARVVLGPHGGAWSNIVFCPDGSDVVEFLPLIQLRNAGRNERPCFYGLACGLGLRYWTIAPDNFHFDRPVAMRVPVPEVLSVLRRLGVAE